jgi:gluconolactonase
MGGSERGTDVELSVEVRDPALRRLVPEGVALERVATGFDLAEGPVWRGDHLLFVDVRGNRILRYEPGAGGGVVATFREPSNQANGQTLDKPGRLLTCEMGVEARRITRTEADGTVEVLADRWEGRRLNATNDIVCRSDGSIYFTDPGRPASYGIREEIPFYGVYRLGTEGEVTAVARDFAYPNGLAFSPDERTLYVDDTRNGHIRAFDVQPDGMLANGRVLCELKGDGAGAPDGMKLDREGNLYCTGPGGVWVVAPEGRVLGRLLMPEHTLNLAWGDADWQSLYLTTVTSLYRLRLPNPGIAVP